MPASTESTIESNKALFCSLGWQRVRFFHRQKYGGIDRKYWTVMSRTAQAFFYFGRRGFSKTTCRWYECRENLNDQEEPMASGCCFVNYATFWKMIRVRVCESLCLSRWIFIPERFLDTEEAAAIMKIPSKTLPEVGNGRAWCADIRRRQLWRFRASEIEEWAQRQNGELSKK